MASRRQRPLLESGSPAPGFRLSSLEGGDATLAEWTARGRVLLVFFKVTCPVCQLTMPFLERMHGSGRLAICGISQNDAADTREFNQYFGVTFGTLLDSEDEGFPASNAYGIASVPSMFLVEADGVISRVIEGWSKADMFSAVAYFFARELEAKLDVPIGLIDSYWGGTPVEAWMSLRALSSNAQFMPAFAQWSDMIADYTLRAEQRQKRLKDWQDAVARAKAEGRPRPPGLGFEENQENSWMPAGLYNAMIAPLTAYPIGGVIWYQGESNASAVRAPLYAAMFETMIRDWRRAWGVGDFPFLFVQLANFRTGPTAKWPEIDRKSTRLNSSHL